MKNYYQLQLKELEKIALLKQKPTLLLHTCCALCFSSAFMQIKDYFQISVFFFNPNIYPLSEYEKRKKELLRLIDIFNKKNNSNIKFIEQKEDFISYNDCKNHFHKCYDCLNYRLFNSFVYAENNNYDYVTTTLTVGRLKDSYLINSLGETISINFNNCKYFYSDFKKNKGIDLSLQLKKEYNIYAQNYCGCEKFYDK